MTVKPTVIPAIRSDTKHSTLYFGSQSVIGSFRFNCFFVKERATKFWQQFLMSKQSLESSSSSGFFPALSTSFRFFASVCLDWTTFPSVFLLSKVLALLPLIPFGAGAVVLFARTKKIFKRWKHKLMTLRLTLSNKLYYNISRALTIIRILRYATMPLIIFTQYFSNVLHFFTEQRPTTNAFSPAFWVTCITRQQVHIKYVVVLILQ